MSSIKWGKHLKILSISILFFPVLSGCWDRVEIEERATVLAIAIDKTELEEEEEEGVTHIKDDSEKRKDSDYRVTVQIAIPGRLPLGPGTASGGGGGGESKPVWVLEAKGHTLDDALTILQQQIEYKVFLGHLRVIIVSEEIAKDGLKEISDYIRRNSDVRRAAWLLVSKEEASSYIYAQPELERVPAIYIMNTMDAAVRLGKFPNDFVGVFWSILSSKGQDSYLPYVELQDKKNIKIAGLAYFKEDKMVDATKPLQIGHFMAIMQMNPGGYKGLITLSDQNATVMIESVQRKSDKRVVIKDGKPHATVKVHLEVDITEKSQGITLNDSDMIKKVEEQFPANSEKSFAQLIKTTQEAESDIFGFGEYVRAKQPSYWNSQVKTKEKWRELYKDMPVDVNVTITIRRVGMKAR